jgi:uncharacterized protein (DUF58 family)
MPIRRRAWLTREGWYYLAVLAFIIGGAVLRSVNLLVILAGTMIAPLLFNWRLVMASLTGLIVRRQPLPQMLAGETLTVQIDIENTRWWMSSWLVTLEDCIERDETGTDSQDKRAGSWWRVRPATMRAEARIPHVPAAGRAMGTYRVTLGRRGRYRFGPLRVSTRFPLGLVRAQMTLPEYGELIVAPRLGRLLPTWVSLLEAELVGDERRHPQRGLSEGDYYGLRPWQSGDSLRWIHWRTTAKLARPIVRQYERRNSREVAIILDPWLPSGATEQEEGLVELAISLTATAITDMASRGHSRLTVAIAGHPALCTSGPASNLFCEELLARLAELAPGQDYQLADVLNRTLEAAPRGARLIVVSSRASDASSLAGSETELPLDPEDLIWIDTSSEQLETLFSLSP